MLLRYSIVLFLSVALFSCKKENADTISIEGVVTDDVSNLPVPGIVVSVDAIKSPSGWGILTDGKREPAGRVTTDANGYYKVNVKIFNEAEFLEFTINPGRINNNYDERYHDTYLSSLNRSATNKIDFALSPTAVLKIKFKNQSPVSDSDEFYFGNYSNGYTSGILQKENCGTISANDAMKWIGKNVCGAYTYQTAAERYSYIFWTVKKNGITNNYRDSVLVRRGVLNEYSINY
jgi:hypothetical protein